MNDQKMHDAWDRHTHKNVYDLFMEIVKQSFEEGYIEGWEDGYKHGMDEGRYKGIESFPDDL